MAGCSSSYVPSAPSVSDGEHLVDVRFDGNRVASDDEVRRALAGPHGDARVRRDEFERGVLMLNAAYYDRGYLTVRVDVEGTRDAAVVHINEGERYRLAALDVVEIDANGDRVELLPAAAAVVPELTRGVGDWFNRAALITGIQKIRRAYRDAGFAQIEGEPETALDRDHGLVRLHLPLRRGPLVHLENVRVVGLKDFPEALVRREIGLASGDLFNETKLDRARERLQALGRFKRVDVSTDAAGRVIVFELEEGTPAAIEDAESRGVPK